MRGGRGRPRLRVLITDPEAAILEKPGLLWSVSGLEACERAILAARGSEQDELETEIIRRAGDASILKVRFATGRPSAVVAWRGLWSDHHIFWAACPDGDVIVGDHFRNVLSALPVSERETSDAALVEHFLYRQVLGGLSYCRAVQRPGHGERLLLDLSTGNTKTSLVDRIQDRAEDRPTAAYLDQIDCAMASVLEPLREEEGVANQFSGGVDSTLVQTYLGSKVPALNLVPDTPEFRRETEYASRAAALLGVALERRPVREADYLGQLERTIDAMGLPPVHEGTVLDRECYVRGFRKFVVGEHGDTVFGLGGRRARIAWHLSSPPGRAGLALASCLAPASLRERLEPLRAAARELRRDPEDPLGHPAQRNLYTDYPLVEKIFGPELVRDRLSANLDYAFARVALSAPKGRTFLRNLETARWLGTFDDVVLPQRHLAHAYGKSVVSPFAAPGVIASVLAVPLARRYLHGLQDKYLLKRLLERRLPGYPVNQRKRSTALPFARYYRRGPLSGVWDRYPLPDFIEAALRRRVVEDASDLTWNAITWAIWQERVARNPDLEPVSGTRILSWEL